MALIAATNRLVVSDFENNRFELLNINNQVREAERQKVVRNRVHLLQMNLLFLSNIAYFIATTYKYVYRESPHAWVANFVLFYFTAVPFGHMLPSAPMATAKQDKQSVQSNL